jgi:hypothetical protein
MCWWRKLSRTRVSGFVTAIGKCFCRCWFSSILLAAIPSTGSAPPVGLCSPPALRDGGRGGGRRSPGARA